MRLEIAMAAQQQPDHKAKRWRLEVTVVYFSLLALNMDLHHGTHSLTFIFSFCTTTL